MEKDAANRQYFEQQQREWNADGGGDIASTFDYEAAFGRFERHIAQEKDAPLMEEDDADETASHRLWSINHPWLRLQLRVVASVAAVALIVIGTWLSYNRYTKQYADRFANMVNVEAPAGSRAKVMLPDGTAVWLNAGSQLSYSQGFGATYASTARDISRWARVRTCPCRYAAATCVCVILAPSSTSATIRKSLLPK